MVSDLYADVLVDKGDDAGAVILRVGTVSGRKQVLDDCFYSNSYFCGETFKDQVGVGFRYCAREGSGEVGAEDDVMQGTR